MKTLLSLAGGALTITEQGGVFTLSVSEKTEVGGGQAEGDRAGSDGLHLAEVAGVVVADFQFAAVGDSRAEADGEIGAGIVVEVGYEDAAGDGAERGGNRGGEAVLAEIQRRKAANATDSWALLREAEIQLLNRQHAVALPLLQAIDPAGLTADELAAVERGKVFGRNAERLYNLDLSAAPAASAAP